jgi:hypothetical protein
MLQLCIQMGAGQSDQPARELLQLRAIQHRRDARRPINRLVCHGKPFATGLWSSMGTSTSSSTIEDN